MARVILDWDQKYKKAVLISDFLNLIRAKISIPNTSKKLLKRLGKSVRHISDFISPISTTGRFDLGLYFEIKDILTSDPDIEFDILTTDPLLDQIIQSYTWCKQYSLQSLNLPYRPYQEKCIRKCIHMGYGNVIIGTAGGKTLIMAGIIKNIITFESHPFTVLVILPPNLVEQTYKEFISYGISGADISMWNRGNELKSSPIILASVDTLRANLTTFKNLKPETAQEFGSTKNSPEYLSYLKEFGKKEKARQKEWNKKRRVCLKNLQNTELVLVDEVHGLRKDNIINDVLGFFSTRHKFGFTGTLPPDPVDRWNIIGQIGPVLINENSAALRKDEYISQVKIQIIKINYTDPPVADIKIDDPSSAYLKECDFLYHNKYRNNIISHLSERVNKNCLIMVDKIDHGETLKDIISKNTNKRVFFIRGSIEMDERESVKRLMEENDNIICIAMSRIFAVGINIKNLHYVIFAQGGKAKVTLIQSIGRGLRLHKDKECLIILDITDSTHYGEKHLQDRITYYKDEEIDYEIKEIYE